MLFEMAFMPSVLRHSENKLMFQELIDEKIMNDFMEAIFGQLLSQQPNQQPQRIHHIDKLKQNLETSQHISYEQFQIEIVKFLNLIFRYFEFNTIQLVCPQKEINKINQFLYQCSKKSYSSILKEWAYYTITSMFIRILADMPQENNEYLLNMIAQTSEQILMLILQHGNNLTIKALVHKSFRNLIDILNNRAIISRIQNDHHDFDYVTVCLKRALTFEGRQTQSLLYLASFILANKEALYRSHQHLINRMNKIISRLGATLQPNLAQKQLVVELSAVVIEWLAKRYIEDQTYMNLQICSNILFFLIRTAVMLQFSQNEPMKEVIDLSNLCLKQIKRLVQYFPRVRIQFPLFTRLIHNDSGDKENLQIIKMALLNVSHILIKYQRHIEFQNFFFELIVNTNTKYQKGILFSCKIINFIVLSNQDRDYQQSINEKVKKLLEQDLQKCQEENVVDIQGKIKLLEDRYNLERKPVFLSFQEQASLISAVIPHFTIRLIESLDREAKNQGIDLNQKGFVFADNDFQLYKNLATSIFKVVGYFRKHLICDQMDASLIRMKTRHNVVHQVINATTQFTSPDLVTFTDDIVELKIEDTNYDLFNKETIMLGTLLIVKKLKKMEHSQSIQIFELVQYTIQALLKYNTNEYIIEWLRKIIDALIEDEQGDTTILQNDQKALYVMKMLSKISEIQNNGGAAGAQSGASGNAEKREVQALNMLIERIFEQSVRFLEKQTSLMSEHITRLFEKVFIHSKGKSVHLKQRLFAVFEKLSNASLYKKLQYYFSKHQLDENDKLAILQSQSQLLDFTLYNFRLQTPLEKTKYSSRLFPFFDVNIKFQKAMDLEEKRNDPVREVNSEYSRLNNLLKPFTQKVRKFQGMQLSSLMEPLSEIISINPSHSTDKLISDKLFIKLFWQYWNILSREEQQYLSESINQYFLDTIPNLNNQEFRKNAFPKTFLESVAALSPQIRLEPEVLQLLGKNLNLWHVTIPILENQINLYPNNERYFFSLNELYGKLAEEDYIAGLRRMVTESAETRSIISYGQHQMWEEINQQFSHYIIYYAEQEGLYAQMDREYNIPGKYQRQIPHQTFQRLQQTHEDQINQRCVQERAANPEMTIDQTSYVRREMDKLYNQIVQAAGVQGNHKPQYPKKGPNNTVKEVDLRIWETLFIESLKVLNKWDQYRDIAHALNNPEMMIEYLWNVKEWRNLAQYEPILKKSDNIKYQLYYIYLIIYQQQINQFDDIFKHVIQLSYKEWDQNLPNYVDNIQFENLIMFQLVMESSEGGRNMIKEAQNLKVRGRLGDLKTAINIWRERVPHFCESIQSWKEVLENRNFIQDQIGHIITPVQQQIQLPQEQQQQQIRQLEQYRQQFVNEFLDKAWNYFKLAQVSRKQGLPQLALYYIGQMRNQITVSLESEGTRYEKFKCDFEYLKLNLEFNAKHKSLANLLEEFVSLIQQRYLSNQGMGFENWQSAELCRLLGDYYLKVGKLNQAQKYLQTSIELNKKEAKAWMSFASLNQTIHQYKKDEISLQNILKGYFSAAVLNLHKSRLIIPKVFKVLKRRELNTQAFNIVGQFIRQNLDQMPTWIWIFWIPQIIDMLYKSHNQLEAILSKTVLEKLCKLYPQAVYFRLKMKQQNFPYPDEQHLQQMTQAYNFFMQHIKKSGYQAISSMERISSEFNKNLKSSTEEELYIVLRKILCMSQYFKIDHFERDFSSFLIQLHQRFFNEANIGSSQLMSELKKKFESEFLNEETKEKEFLEIIKSLKNLKDFLHKKLSLAELKTNLEQISPYLANFNEKGVELPGQFMTSDTEPVPQNTIFIQRFEPVIYRGGVTTKKILIKGSNQRVYAFTSNMIQSKEDYSKYCHEEKILQLKMIMNQIFRKNKETLRRGIKFYVPIKVLISRIKLTQDDLSFANLQEIHDYLFQERGLDSDQALNLQIRKVEDIFNESVFDEQNNAMSQERNISSISAERKQRIIEETYDEMKSLYCQPYLLSSFFHRIFYNVDDLFIFKKQFTTYHAVNSFFCYIFNQVEYFTLNQISFCKTSGRLNFNDAKIQDFLKTKNLKSFVQRTPQSQAIDFEQLEQQDIQQNPSYLPFRLTNNIVDFIGRVGLNGLFAGVLTSCSMALGKHYEKIMPLLQIIYRDEFSDENEALILYINICCDYIKYKMTSLSQNKNVLNIEQFEADQQQANQQQQPGQDHRNQQQPRQEEEQILFGQFKVPKDYLCYEMEKPNIMEEFNKKVFDLIDISMDEKRLSQMPSNWNAWF